VVVGAVVVAGCSALAAGASQEIPAVTARASKGESHSGVQACQGDSDGRDAPAGTGPGRRLTTSPAHVLCEPCRHASHFWPASTVLPGRGFRPRPI
jgi:hypothetical protein